MSSDNDAAARRIMHEFGETSRIPYLNIEQGDVAVLAAFPIVGLFAAGFIGVESLALPLVAAGLGLGVAIVYVTPAHQSAVTWVSDIYRYAKRPRLTFSAPSREADPNGNHDRNRGGLANHTPFTPDERTQDLTQIERAWPGAGAIQRTDGAMEAFLEVDPGNMDFAMAADWATLQQAGAEFANKELDYKLKFHATTRSFPVEHIVETIEARLGDEDVTGNPVFRELVEEYHKSRPTEMRDRGIQQLSYYIGVEVSPLEVYDRYRDEQTPAEKLTQFPVIGFLFNPFVTRREDYSEAEIRAKMFEKLDDRLTDVRAEFVQHATGWSARRLSTVELFTLNMDFWNGEEHEYGNARSVIRDHAVVGRSRRGGEADA